MKKKIKAKRARWTLRPEHGERVIMAWARKPSDVEVQLFVRDDYTDGPPVPRGFVLCYDGKPKAAWDVRVSMEVE